MRKIRVLVPQRWHVALRRGGHKNILRILLIIALVFAAFWLCVFWIDNHFRPIITQMAKVRVDYLASKAINEAITKKIDDGSLEYGKMVYFEKDIYGQITALKTDMIRINKLKADIINEVLDAVEGIGTSDLAIPLGNIINGNLLSGRGPRIPVRIMPIGTASANFSHSFESAGINQTRHQIMMEVQVNIDVLMPGYSAETVVTVEVTVAETIIVGAVPDSYTYFEDGGKIFSNAEKYSSALEP